MTGDLTRYPDGTSDATTRALDVIADALAAPGTTGDLTRLDIHPDDLLGNESVRTLCAHYLEQNAPVTRATLAKWRRLRSFPAPLPCARAGVDLWDARDVRAWVQAWALERGDQRHRGPDPS